MLECAGCDTRFRADHSDDAQAPAVLSGSPRAAGRGLNQSVVRIALLTVFGLVVAAFTFGLIGRSVDSPERRREREKVAREEQQQRDAKELEAIMWQMDPEGMMKLKRIEELEDSIAKMKKLSERLDREKREGKR
jgi:hypothetical protein